MHLCDCTKYCKRLKEVSKSTYQRHARFRELDFTNTYNGRHSLRPAHIFPPARDTSSNDAGLDDLGRDGAMAEPHEVCLVRFISGLTHLHVRLTSMTALQASRVVMELWLNHAKYVLYSANCSPTHLHIRLTSTMVLQASKVVIELWLNRTKYVLYSTNCGLTHLHVRLTSTTALQASKAVMQLRTNGRTTQPDTMATSRQKKSPRTQVVWRKDLHRTGSQTRACPILTLRNSPILSISKISRLPWNLSAPSRWPPWIVLTAVSMKPQ